MAVEQVSPQSGRQKSGSFWRFLLSGGFNTVVTYMLYLLLELVLDYRASYTTAFIAGIALAYWLNRIYVFRVKGSRTAATLFPLVYLAQYSTGLMMVSLWVEILGFNARLAPLAAIAVTIPLTYILSRWVFLRC